jgi:hypothetical protein
VRRRPIALALLACAVGAPAPADEVRPHVIWDLGAGTTLPLCLCASGMAELEGRILLGVDIGWMPRPYVDLMDGTVMAFGGWDQATADLVADSLQSSVIVRISGGWRPFAAHGFEVLVGYTLASLGGGVSKADTIEAVTGRQFDPDTPRDVPISSQLHAFHLSLGWRFALRPHLGMRVAVGYLQAFASKTTIDRTGRTIREDDAIRAVEAALDDYLDRAYTTYVKAPVVSVTASYRW